VGSFYPMQPGMYQHILGVPAAITSPMAPGYIPPPLPILLSDGIRAAHPALLLDSVLAKGSKLDCALVEGLTVEGLMGI